MSLTMEFLKQLPSTNPLVDKWINCFFFNSWDYSLLEINPEINPCELYSQCTILFKEQLHRALREERLFISGNK